MNPIGQPLERLIAELDDFVGDRQWHHFHKPKNLVMALSAEVGELTEHFMWLDADQLPRHRDEVTEEIGDVLIYLLHLCRELEVDAVQAALTKLDKARDKYPAP